MGQLQHVSRDSMERFFRSETAEEEGRQIVRHLVSGCSRCLELAQEVCLLSGFLTEEDLASAGFDSDPESYAAAFLRLLRQSDPGERRLAHEKLRAVGQWAELETLSPGQRLLRVRHEERFQNWGLFERLLEKAQEQVWRDPVSAVDVAHLALVVADRLAPDRYGVGRVADFRAAALAAVGNAKRLATDFDGSQAAFIEARQAFAAGTRDPLQEAHITSLEGSLLKDLGDLEGAARRLERAVEIYREAGDRHLEGRTLLKESEALGHLDPARGVELVQAALALIDPVREPRLEICARHNLIWFLNDSGKPWEALVLLETSRPLYRQFPDTWPRLSLRWVEGRIARNLGDLEDAEHTFQSLWQDLWRRELHHLLILLSIDLAEVQVARGRQAEAVRLVREVHPLLQRWGMHTEGLALWLLFQESLAAGKIRADTFRRMAEYVRRAWFRPLADREAPLPGPPES